MQKFLLNRCSKKRALLTENLADLLAKLGEEDTFVLFFSLPQVRRMGPFDDEREYSSAPYPNPITYNREFINRKPYCMFVNIIYFYLFNIKHIFHLFLSVFQNNLFTRGQSVILGQEYDIFGVISLTPNSQFHEGWMDANKLQRRLDMEDRDASDEEFAFLQSKRNQKQNLSSLNIEQVRACENERMLIFCIGVFAIIVRKIPHFNKYNNLYYFLLLFLQVIIELVVNDRLVKSFIVRTWHIGENFSSQCFQVCCGLVEVNHSKFTFFFLHVGVLNPAKGLILASCFIDNTQSAVNVVD